MGRNNFDYTHGDTGTKPTSALDFETNGRPDSQNFDWWWYTTIENINAHADEFDRLDSDGDGTVDEADYSLDSDKLDGNHWSDVKNWVNNNTAGNPHGDSAHTEDYLKDATQFADANHTHSQLHNRYSDSEARNAVTGIVDISDLDGSKGTTDDVVVTDGNDLYYTDISNAGSDYSDADARSAINNDSDHGSKASHNYFSGSHDSLSNVNSSDHHSKTNSASELGDVSADSVSDAHHTKTVDTRIDVESNGTLISSEPQSIDFQAGVEAIEVSGNTFVGAVESEIDHDDLNGGTTSNAHHTQPNIIEPITVGTAPSKANSDNTGVAIGNNASLTHYGQFAIGDGATAQGSNAIAIGDGCVAGEQNAGDAVALGTNATANTGDFKVKVGGYEMKYNNGELYIEGSLNENQSL